MISLLGVASRSLDPFVIICLAASFSIKSIPKSLRIQDNTRSLSHSLKGML